MGPTPEMHSNECALSYPEQCSCGLQERIVIAMTKDWAEECAERWFKRIGEDTGICGAIEGAIREALEKAAEVASKAETTDAVTGDFCDHAEAVKAIRALGAK